MKAPVDAARLLGESNPVAQDAFAGAAGDSLGRATFERIIVSSARPAPGTAHPPRRRRLVTLTAVAAGAVVVAGLLTALLPGQPRLTRPVHTAWAPARPLPGRAVAPAGGPAGSWRLASYLVTGKWQENTAGPEPGALTCPTAMTCYVAGYDAASVGPDDMDTMYVSYNGAGSWNTLPVPAGLTFTSALSCRSATRCAAGAVYYGQPALATTVDGAHSWTIDPLPAGDGQLFTLDCPTATTCAGLVSTKPTIALQWHVGVKFLSTTDGGRHFATSSFPAGALAQEMTCPTATHCVALAVNDVRYSNPESIVLITSDGGARWSHGTFPAGLAYDASPLTCVDASHCYMIGNVHFESTAMAVTADGGHTWTDRPFPASVPGPQMIGIACPAAETCYTSGFEGVPQPVSAGELGDSPVVLITHNAGLTWTRVTFPIPAHVPPALRADPLAFLAVSEIQCPQPGVCIALGTASQGARSTPVYTTGGP